MLIPNLCSFERLLVILFINFLKDILESTILFLQDGILGAEIQGPLLFQGEMEATVRKIANGLIGIVHPHEDTRALEIKKREKLASLRQTQA